MGHWLAPAGSAKLRGHVKRFDARLWTVNFPRPMMASLVTTGANAFRVDAIFYHRDALAGIIWEAEDRHDHPLLAYETSRDFRGCVLSFRWRSQGVKPLDALHGPTLTIEGRDASGAARSWYVRLWNYASGSSEDALVSLDFDALAGGFLHPAEADPVWAGDIDRMFISLVAPGYDQGTAPLAAPAEGWAELSEISREGAGSVLSVGEVLVPEHDLRIATGYDDLYHLAPERMLRNILALGYRGIINHYVGMSHYFRLGSDEHVDAGLNVPCARWHEDFARRAKALGFELILSLSYELIDMHCPEAWKQRASDGSPALTGWVPPSALLSPANSEAMAWLQEIARQFAAIARDCGQRVRFQVGEPWWWVRADGTICIYDDAAVARLAPELIADIRASLSAAQQATLDRAGALLAESTAALCAAVKTEAPQAETLLLIYLPTILEGAEAQRANLPSQWAYPAFDVLQLEDYDWVIGGNESASARGAAEAGARLGYALERQHYLAGFVLRPEDRALWQPVAGAIATARARGVAETFIWALPQVLRDGFTWFEVGEDGVEPFEDVRFPVAIGREASVEAGFSTAIVTSASGHEQRNSDWADARMRFDAGPGVRGEAELGELMTFFRARRGSAIAFRFEDPFDHEGEQQLIGIGDGIATSFPLIKTYGEAGAGQVRRITRPVAASVRLFIDGVEKLTGWMLSDKAVVQIEQAPADGSQVRASYRFDVPVRFAEDRLTVSRATFAAGEIPSVPLIEVRE